MGLADFPFLRSASPLWLSPILSHLNLWPSFLPAVEEEAAMDGWGSCRRIWRAARIVFCVSLLDSWTKEFVYELVRS